MIDRETESQKNGQKNVWTMEGQADRRTKECMEERIGIMGWTNGWTWELRNEQADEWTDKTILGFSVLEDSVTASKHIFGIIRVKTHRNLILRLKEIELKLCFEKTPCFAEPSKEAKIQMNLILQFKETK